jgi:hypothetical protein
LLAYVLPSCGFPNKPGDVAGGTTDLPYVHNASTATPTSLSLYEGAWNSFDQGAEG